MWPARSFGGAVALSFARDWFVTIGWLQPDRQAYKLWRARLKLYVFAWLPVGLRIMIAALVLASGYGYLVGVVPPGRAAGSWLLALLGALGGLAVLLGAGARAGAGLVSLAAYVDFASGGHAWQLLTLLCLASLLIVLGSGRFTLWIPEERWLRIGAGGDA